MTLGSVKPLYSMYSTKFAYTCTGTLTAVDFITAISTVLSPITAVRRADALSVVAQECSTAT